MYLNDKSKKIVENCLVSVYIDYSKYKKKSMDQTKYVLISEVC